MKLNEEQKQTAIEVLNELLHDNTSLTKTAVERFKKKYNLSPTIEVGKVYKDVTDKYLFLITDKKEDKYSRYGLDAAGCWHNEILESLKCERLIEATQEEWIEVLKKEGDKYIGKTVKCLYDGKVVKVNEYAHLDSEGTLWYNEGFICLMENGVWATVVNEKIEQIHQLQKQLDNLQDQINELTK